MTPKQYRDYIPSKNNKITFSEQTKPQKEDIVLGPVLSRAKRYRKKPVVVEAIQWMGKNDDQVVAFLGYLSMWVEPESGKNPYDGGICMEVRTLEGNVFAHIGDWIVKGVKGELYPVRDDIFQMTYEEVV